LRSAARTLANPRAADPALFAPYNLHRLPDLRWKVVQRGFWVHRFSRRESPISREFDNREALRSIRCRVFLAWEENDPTAASAAEVYDAPVGPKTLVRFLAAEGAGDHCALLARSLFHPRMFDWLDGVLGDGRRRAQ
jgi:pimeloyl-ACP methyl ester carboxylesterase